MSRPENLMACAVCGFVLDSYGPMETSETWLHNTASPDDHEPVPVPAESIVTNFRCDCCLADHARWALPVEDYTLTPGHRNRGDWATCDTCAAIIRKDDWKGLIDRVRALENARGNRAPRGVYVVMYDQLRKHITGTLHLNIGEISND